MATRKCNVYTAQVKDSYGWGVAQYSAFTIQEARAHFKSQFQVVQHVRKAKAIGY